jgi:hypothetical protein
MKNSQKICIGWLSICISTLLAPPVHAIQKGREGVMYYMPSEYADAVQEAQKRELPIFFLVGKLLGEKIDRDSPTSIGANFSYLQSVRIKAVLMYIVVDSSTNSSYEGMPEHLIKAIKTDLQGRRLPVGFIIDPFKNELYKPDAKLRYYDDQCAAWLRERKATRLANLKERSSKSEFTCKTTIDAFDPKNPNQAIGQFQPGTVLTVHKETEFPGFRQVTLKNLDGTEVSALCRAADVDF